MKLVLPAYAALAATLRLFGYFCCNLNVIEYVCYCLLRLEALYYFGS